MKNNWTPVIEDIIKCLLNKGLTLHSVDNGDGGVFVDNTEEAVGEIEATDESHLYVKNPDGKTLWVYIVLGNQPEETICDYTVDPLIDEAFGDFTKIWEGRDVPKK